MPIVPRRAADRSLTVSPVTRRRIRRGPLAVLSAVLVAAPLAVVAVNLSPPDLNGETVAWWKSGRTARAARRAPRPVATSTPVSPTPVSPTPVSPTSVSADPVPSPTVPSPTVPSATVPSATVPSPTVPAPTTVGVAPAGRTRLTPEQFGADGTDTTDDTAALQRALDATGPGSYLDIAAGRTYRHDAVLRITRDGAWVHGTGTILATDEEQAAIFADGDDVTLDGGLTIGLTDWTVRHTNWETFGVRSLDASRLVMRDVTVSRLEVYLHDADGFTLERVRVERSQADGIHLTGGSRNGTVTDVTTVDTGDDGVAVVSYQRDGAPCRDITVTRARVLGTTWGRGVSVIGGTNITYNDLHVERTSAAGVIVAAESSYTTFAPRGVRINGGTVRNANLGAPDHGAVLVHSDRPDAELGGLPLDNVRISGLAIQDTNPARAYTIRVNADGAATLHRVTLSDITISGGPATTVFTDQGPDVLTVQAVTRSD